MKRHLFTIFAGSSLLLFAVVVVMWVRSYLKTEMLRWVSPEAAPPAVYRMFAVDSWSGGISLRYLRLEYGPLSEADLAGPTWRVIVSLKRDAQPGWEYVEGSMPRPRGWLGFGTGHLKARSPKHPLEPVEEAWTLTIPYWFLAVTTSALPGILVVHRWRAATRRERDGHCPACGYDLRASPDRCPECGTPIPITAPQS